MMIIIMAIIGMTSIVDARRGYQQRNNYRQQNRNTYHAKSHHHYDKNDPHYVYTLNLEGGRKYVGRTSDPDKRIDQHFDGQGAKWTQKYRPISIESINEYHNEEESKIGETDEYYKTRDEYGSHLVRGAGHTNSLERDDHGDL